MSIITSVLRRSKKAEEDIVAELYEKYKSEVYRYAYKKLGSISEAEDALSDTFIRIMKNRGQLEAMDEEARRIHVFGCAKLSCIDLHRKRLRQPSTESFAKSTADNGVYEREFASESDTLGSVLSRECSAYILGAIDSLPAEDRWIITAKITLEMKNTEIAEELKMNPSTVSTRVTRIFEKLRKMLEGYVNE